MREVATFAGVGDLIANGGLYTLGQQGKLGHRDASGRGCRGSGADFGNTGCSGAG